MRVCIIGGGLIGLFSAYYLTENGYSVTIIDKNEFDQGASYGNAGMICPSHFTPLAAPGVVRQSLKWMLNDTSPFYIKPRLDKNFIYWCLKFFDSSTKKNLSENTGLMSSLLLYSKSLFHELAHQGIEMDLQKKGILMVCHSSHALKEEIEVSHKAHGLGLKTNVLSAREIELLNPGVQINSIGGVHYLDDLHLTPNLLMQSLKKILSHRGVEWVSNNEIIDFKIHQDRILSAIGKTNEVPADAFMLAAGAWSSLLSKKLNHPAYIEGGKGYNITLKNALPNLQVPMILVEGRVAVTPMGRDLRLGGTMEIAGLDDQIRHNRVNGILSSIEKYLPDYPIAKTKDIIPWFGYRPLSSNGMPIIEKIPSLKNAFINTGHGMLGLSLAPVSGKLITEIIYNTMKK